MRPSGAGKAVSHCGEYELATCSGAVLKAALSKLEWLVSHCGKNKLSTCGVILNAALRCLQGL
jgi:hypothetical protein